MSLSYQIKAADGQTYGPASVTELKAWIAEGRVDGDMSVCRSDSEQWLPARDFAELGLGSPAAPPPPPPPIAPPAPAAPASVGAQFDRAMDDGSIFDPQIRDGANWFYWIAGLSLVNALLGALGTNWGFALGLAVAGVFGAIGKNIGGQGAAGEGGSVHR